MNNLFFPRWRRRPRLCSVLFLSRRGSPTGGCNDKTQGSLWSGSKRTILRAVSLSPGLALPAVSICQPRSAKRCVSVEGGGGAAMDRESDAPVDDHIVRPFPSVPDQGCVSTATIGGGPRGLMMYDLY